MPPSLAPTTVASHEVEHFEGLVRKTASMVAPLVQEDYPDICQALRIKVWQALLAFDPAKARQTRDAYVFMCVFNRVKDLKKKVRRNESYIEDLAPTTGTSEHGTGARDAFERRYLSVDDEQEFAQVIHGDPLIPSTLTAQERRVLLYLYFDFSQVEIACQMVISRKEVAAAVRGLREKMADWKPGDAVEPAGIAVEPPRIAA